MYAGLLAHSPDLAHPGQLAGSSSTHFGSRHTPVSKRFSWIHLVAVHFTPPTVGQLACVLAMSDPPFFLKLKNSTASPRRGFTASPRPSRHAQSLSSSLMPRSRCATAGRGFPCGNEVSPPFSGSCRNMRTVAIRLPPFGDVSPSWWSLYSCPSWYLRSWSCSWFS